jgi:hypothetical protein
MLFAILYDLLFAAVVVAVILGLRRIRIKTWVFCAGTLFGSALLWLLMFAILVFLIGPNVKLENEGHALSDFITPYLVLGVGIVLLAPILAYELRTPNR